MENEHPTNDQGVISREEWSPFDRTYMPPEEGEKFDDHFAHLCEVNFGYSRIASQRYFELLSRIPRGFRYHGGVRLEDVDKYRKTFPGLVVVDSPVYNGDGKLMEGYVAIAVPGGHTRRLFDQKRHDTKPPQ